jgi:8-oxo-(d)GTP phosphatase
MTPHPDHAVVRTVHLVRHAKAVEREGWALPDHLRPLTDAGHLQAQALVPLYSHHAFRWIRSSPALRCIQTVEPLAKACRLTVEISDSLMEGRRLSLPDEPGDFVLCAHGDNIPWLLDEMGLEWDHCRKGSVWTLRFDAAGRLCHPSYEET